MLSGPRVFHAVIVKYAMHDSPWFLLPQVLRLGICWTLQEHLWVCLYNFSCRHPYLIDFACSYFYTFPKTMMESMSAVLSEH